METKKFKSAVRAVALMLMLCMALSVSAFGATPEENSSGDEVLIKLAGTKLVRSLEFYEFYSDDPNAETDECSPAGPTELIKSQLDLGIDFTMMRMLNPSHYIWGETGLQTYQDTCKNLFAIKLKDITLEEAIEILSANPNIESVEPNHFYPLDPVVNPDPELMDYTDVSEDDWFYGDVRYVYGNSIMNGVSEDSFDPNAPMSRAMAVTVIHRMAGRPTNTIFERYDDLPKDQWYSYAAWWAGDNYITNGRAEGQFEPDANVTRAEFAAMLFRYGVWKRLEYSDSKFCEFDDEKTIPDYAKQAVRMLHQSDIVNGKDYNNFDPSANITRAEAAAMIRRFADNTEKREGGLLEKYGLSAYSSASFTYGDPNRITHLQISFSRNVSSPVIPDIEIVSAKMTCRHTTAYITDDIYLSDRSEADRYLFFSHSGIDEENLHEADGEFFVISITVKIGDETQDLMLYSTISMFEGT